MRKLAYTLGLLSLLACLVLISLFAEAIYHRYCVFPQQAKAWSAIREQYQPPSLRNSLPEYRGILHSHSVLSHDSDVSYPDILAAAKIANIDFLFMSNHCHQGRADYSLGWSGLHDDVLFVRGYEGPHGFLIWNLPDDTVLDCRQSAQDLAADISARGGMYFFAHSEEPRQWQRTDYIGMEVYSIHSDIKDDGEDYLGLLTHLLLSGEKYPDQMLRVIYDRQDSILQHWDQLNEQRQIVGIAATDAHQHVGMRAFYTQDNTLRLMTNTPGDVLAEWHVNWLTEPILRLMYGELIPGKRLFRLEFDPYERYLRYVNNHVLAESLEESAISAALGRGRNFIAFDMIADARGFVFRAELGEERIELGDSHAFQSGITFRAASPYPVKFTLLRNGVEVAQSRGRNFSFAAAAAGNYRLVAELNISGKWVPWLYTNPIYLPAPAKTDPQTS